MGEFLFALPSLSKMHAQVGSVLQGRANSAQWCTCWVLDMPCAAALKPCPSTLLLWDCCWARLGAALCRESARSLPRNSFVLAAQQTVIPNLWVKQGSGDAMENRGL